MTATGARRSARYDVTPLRRIPPDAALSAIAEYLTPPLNAGKNAPCIWCGGRDRARLCRRTGRYYCSHCAPRYMSALDVYLRATGQQFRDGAVAFAARVGVTLDATTDTPARPGQQAAVARVMSQCRAIRPGDPYHRHIALRGVDPDIVVDHPHIRHCDSLRHHDSGTDHPGAVATQYRDGQMLKISRLYLADDGKKADVTPVRMSLSAHTDHMGAVVPVSKNNNEISSVAIGEGVETMLSVGAAVDMPTVAACDAGNMERFTPPSPTKHLYVAVDNDESRRGEQAYHALAARLCRIRPDARVIPVMPARVGTDWADYDHDEIADSWRAAISRVSVPEWEVYL